MTTVLYPALVIEYNLRNKVHRIEGSRGVGVAEGDEWAWIGWKKER